MEASRPNVWLVSPAWRRFDVTRLALAQRAHLAVELAARGIDARVVIVADDDNLTIAREHGFDTVELPNDRGVGAKFNAGFQHAAQHGADYFVHIGSDDWVHPDLFTPILDEHTGRRDRPIITGRRMAFVDLLTGTISQTVIPGSYGVIPWIIPRALMARCDFAPIRPERNRGLDGFLVRGLRRAGPTPRWRFHDPHPVARVDFKSDVNINTFERLPDSLRRATSSDPWPILAGHYPPHLVELARNTHTHFREAPCPR